MKRLLVLGLVTSLAMALLASAASAAPPVMVDVCHFNSLGEWQVNTLRDKGKGLQAHLAHGDALPGEGVPGMADYEFDVDCQPVLIPGSIVISKATNPGGGTGFGFTDNISAPNSFTLDDGQSETFNNLVPGTYAVSETVPSGWDLTSATCDDGSAPSAIVVSAGETVTCTFTNQQRGTIVIVKDAVPDDPQDFTFTHNIGGAGSFTLDDDADATLSNTETFNNVVSGTYAVSETVPSGWDLTSATCDDGSAPSAIVVSAGETVTCTFTNVESNPPDLQLVKDDGGVSVQAGETVVYTLTFANVGGDATGVVVEDTVPANTTFDAAASTGGWSCADGDPAGTVCTIAVGSVSGPSGGGLVTFAAKVDRPIAPGVDIIVNAAEISDDGAGGSDANPADNFSAAITPLAVG